MTVRRRCRSFVLLAVLIIVGSAVLIATSVIYLVSGEVAGSQNERDNSALRAAGWSAVQAVAARLGAQRSAVLEGGSPTIDEEITLWEVDGEIAIARLLPVSARGDRLVAENAKVSLHTATVESLVATGAMEAGLATRVIAVRDAASGRTGSIDALLRSRGGADGLSPDELYGSLEQLTRTLAAEQSDDARERRDARLERDVFLDGAVVPIRDVMTTFAFEPRVRTDGSPCIDLTQEWTDDRRGGLDTLLGAGSSKLLEAAMKVENPSIAGVLAAWSATHPETKEWHALLSNITIGGGELADRIDVQRASAVALRALPGITVEIAQRIVRERETMGAASRQSAAWLVEQGLLERDQFAAIVDRVTTRSFFWRVRVETTLESPSPRSARRAFDDEGGDGRRTVIFEAVVDLTREQPRIALFRDLTGLGTVAQLIRASAAMPLREEFDPIDPIGDLPRSDTDPSIDPAVAESGDPSETDPVSSAPQPPTGGGVGRWRRAE